MGAVKNAFHDEICFGEMVAVDIVRDAKLLACARPEILALSRAEIEEAREHLNDCLHKIDRRKAA